MKITQVLHLILAISTSKCHDLYSLCPNCRCYSRNLKSKLVHILCGIFRFWATLKKSHHFCEKHRFFFVQKGAIQAKTPPPFLRRTCPIELKFGMHILEVLTQLSTSGTRPRTSPRSRAISTGSDLGQPLYEFIGETRNKSYNIWN